LVLGDILGSLCASGVKMKVPRTKTVATKALFFIFADGLNLIMSRIKQLVRNFLIDNNKRNLKEKSKNGENCGGYRISLLNSGTLMD